ncbi:MAG: FRG domain-containing protein [Nanoarchaeota archaeon]
MDIAQEEFASEEVKKWDEFIKQIKKLSPSSEISDKWVYRGLTADRHKLATTLERAREYFDIEWKDLPGVEEQLIRNYRRRFQWERDAELYNDILYCISIMQHHGAPTRLLDFTYSPYIGAFFALENSDNPPNKDTYKKPEDMPVLWCINKDWIEDIKIKDEVVKKIVNELRSKRLYDENRNDITFKPMYMNNGPKKFVDIENPLRLNTRLVIQQGTFLCPGDVTCPFEENLKNLDNWNSSKNVLKIFLNFSKEERRTALHELNRMNINHASLFPGIDGYSRSMRQLIPIFEQMAKNKAGKGGPYKIKEKNCI